MKDYTKYILLFSITYFTSYITRINFGAVISEMVSATQISRDLLSLSLTGSFITYGAGQILSGMLGDRISPKKLVLCGLLVTAAMNLFLPICDSPYLMLLVWCVNGFAQAFMWPPIVKIMTSVLTEEEYKTGCQKVSWGSSVGTIVIYLVSPLLISVSSWKAVFFFSAASAIVMMLIWQKFCPSVAVAQKEKLENMTQKGSIAVLFSPVMLCIMAAIILQGMLRDGVTTWMPTYISETYNLSNVVGILTGVVLPIFSILCFNVATLLYRKKFTNPVLCAAVLFGVGMLSAVMLVFVTGKSAAVSVLSSALLTGCMHGVNLMLICMIPPFFKKYGNVSTASGVINSCTYIGSAISTYGIAVLSQNYGWSFTLFLWVLIALFGTALCFIATKPWQKKMM